MSEPDSVPNPATLPAPASILAHISDRMLAMGEEFRQLAADMGTVVSAVDRLETGHEKLSHRVRELEQRLTLLEADGI